MKRFNRRLFLKTAGAMAGGTILSQACRPVSPGEPTSALDDLLEEVDVPLKGDTFVLPPCCSYTGDYHIDHPPKRPIYGIWARQFEPAIDLLNNPENFPDTASEFIQAIKNCLGFAVDMLFRGDTHSARNALAVIASMLVNVSNIEMSLRLSKPLSKRNPSDWLTINYSDPKTNTDIWDMVAFKPSDLPAQNPTAHAGSAGVREFLSVSNNNSKYPLLSMWLAKLVDLADSLDLWKVFNEDLATTGSEYQNILDDYTNLVTACAPELENQCPTRCKDQPISSAMNEQLTQIGFTLDPSTSYDGAIANLSIAYIGMLGKLRTGLNNHDSVECEKWLGEMSKAIGAMKAVIIELAGVIDQANAATLQNIEKNRQLREEVGNSDKSIWELIPFCLEDATLGRFEDALDDWWGAKKYIIGAACALIHVPIIIASAGTAVIPAIFDFVLCFLEGMLGGTGGVVADFGQCVIENW